MKKNDGRSGGMKEGKKDPPGTMYESSRVWSTWRECLKYV